MKRSLFCVLAHPWWPLSCSGKPRHFHGGVPYIGGMYVGTVGVYDGTVGLYVGTLGTLYDGTVGVYDGTVGVYDGTVGVFVGESFSSTTIPGVIFLPAPARSYACRRVKLVMVLVRWCMYKNSEIDAMRVHVPWDPEPEVSSASDETRREAKHSTTKPVRPALITAIDRACSCCMCGYGLLVLGG